MVDSLEMSIYKRHRFPAEIISYAVWLYHRCNLSLRDIDDLLTERGVAVNYESIRLWCNKFGAKYVSRLKHRHRGYADALYLDEVFVKLNGRQHYLWRAVDQDGEVVDVYLQSRRDDTAAKSSFKRLLRIHKGASPKIVTDKLRIYAVAHREQMPDVIHNTDQYANNRAELSHQPIRVRERGMRRFKSLTQAQQFSGVHATVYNLGRHLVSAEHYRNLREVAFADCGRAAT